MSLTLRSISVAFGSQTVLHQLDLTLETGQIACLLGSSGCGKTTALRVIAGFQQPQTGHIQLNGQDIGHIPAHQRRIGMVFQDYALFPHLTVAQNIGFGLHQTTKSERQNRIQELAELTGLTALLDHHPHQISGGQQQRVALARALAPRPQLILLDEPFSNLDADLRHRLAQDVRQLLKQQNTAALMVTHDQQEAFAFADQIGLMQHGKLIQWDSPQNLYQHPATLQVAQFIGQGSCINGRIIDPNRVQTALGELTTQPHNLAPDTAVTVFLRPEALHTAPTHGTPVQINHSQFKGTHWQHQATLPEGNPILFHTLTPCESQVLLQHQGQAVVFAATETA